MRMEKLARSGVIHFLSFAHRQTIVMVTEEWIIYSNSSIEDVSRVCPRERANELDGNFIANQDTDNQSEALLAGHELHFTFPH